MSARAKVSGSVAAGFPSPAEQYLEPPLDRLNARYGRGAVFSAAEGIGARSWQMKRGKLSGRFTTNWDELPIVR